MLNLAWMGHVGLALLLGSIIGFERQWRQRIAGLRTNALVSVGSALFVMLSVRTGTDRIAAQVVTGIGFIGGGVILREGLNVRGLNTAATLWCSAAVGTLAGYGLILPAMIGTVAVLLANIGLRPLARKINRTPIHSEEEIHYSLRVISRSEEEAHVRALLLHMVKGEALTLQSLSSADLDPLPKVEVTADLITHGRHDACVEQLVSRLSLEQGVSAVRWEILGAEST